MILRRIMAAAVATTVCGAPAAVAQGPGLEPSVQDLGGRVRDLDQRLTNLSPARPVEYLLLGEEVLAEANTGAERRLARELLVLAIAMEIRSQRQAAERAAAGGKTPAPAQGAASPIGRSASMALAQLADSDQDRRWLLAVAATLGADLGLDPAPMTATVASRLPGAFELATVLGLSRSGEGARAERLLRKPGVEPLLESFDKVLRPYAGGGAAEVRWTIETWPVCPRCRNRRAVKEGTAWVICPKCKGTPGPDLSAEEIENHLRAESLLLSGVQRSWTAQVVTDSGAPLRDLDPMETVAAYAVDPEKCLWRDGRWVRDPSLPPRPAPGPQKPVEPPPPAEKPPDAVRVQ